jgi:hypothetical protein
LFRAEGQLVVSQRAKDALTRAGVTNVEFQCVTEFLRDWPLDFRDYPAEGEEPDDGSSWA